MSRGSYDLHLYHFAILLNEKNVFIIKHCIVVLHKEKKKKTDSDWIFQTTKDSNTGGCNQKVTVYRESTDPW